MDGLAGGEMGEGGGEGLEMGEVSADTCTLCLCGDCGWWVGSVVVSGEGSVDGKERESSVLRQRLDWIV